MFVRGQNSGGTNAKAELYVAGFTADTRVELGFKPKQILLVYYCPNYSSSKNYTFKYDEELWGDNIQYWAGQTSTGDFPIPNTTANSMGIKSIDSTGFVVGYSSSTGAGVSFGYSAIG